MTRFDAQATKNAQAREAIPLIVAAGAALGYWKAQPIKTCEDPDGTARWVDLETAEGLRFSLGGGAWNEPGRVSLRVNSRNAQGVQASPRKAVIAATADALKRTPEAIAKDLHRRVSGSPEGIAQARQVLADWQQAVGTGAALRAVIAQVQALGYRINENNPPKLCAYTAPMWSEVGPVRRLEVYHGGTVRFDVDVPVGKLAALLDLLRAP
jgi:hypothetical protein